LKLTYWIETLVAPFRKGPVLLEIDRSDCGVEPIIASNPALTYGIGNFIENAVDFAKTKVIIACTCTNETITISISDDGPGYPNEILLQIGEPYLKAKSRRRLKNGVVSGLGLGIFIAKTLLERTGAELRFSNNNDSGAIVEVTWDRKRLELTP
jgi:two-component system sensor histidine kinase RegB